MATTPNSYLSEEANWPEHVYMIDQNDDVLGGPDGAPNVQSKNLADRTQWLKKNKADVDENGDLKPWIDCDAVTRINYYTISVAGDQSTKFPQGKLMRFNGDDATKCRVLGVPTVSDGATSIMVWFEVAQNLPETITKLERSPLPPYSTPYAMALVTTTQYSAEMIQKLKDSYCYSSVTIKGA